ncbi:helix-turn-helix domain-containing protein [Streptomyces sp. AV19]|uniref:helix-turn-helix transcriptional regulator n=1 Tax=Streptomyces sp. AV19 TaxID=2793068 RepID=UPI0018FEACC0|nr:helix-turn-helix transcriptional regulator [Streptomyces sp. AV19]MBH1937876.1 helix-turn-helix domain-containing protein [Streptomyces sp. AV19]MDG4536525.1 helix-turn-helix transcriptional regulator [Streptomyces sp. AV19]
MDRSTELSEFLRSRRARLRPEDVGLTPFGGRRRVPGLRREELAQVAGVSVAYYTRLEQGRGQNVSDAVLDAIAGALRLTGAERSHLNKLARPAARGTGRGAARPQRVRPAVRNLLDTMDNVPAYVLGRRMDILAWNRLAAALLGDFAAVPAQRRNMAWMIFLDPASRELYAEWDRKAADIVALLRMHAGSYPDDPALASLIGELSMKSEEFRRLWAAHDVRDKCYGVKKFHHPVVGGLTLNCETLVLPQDPDQSVVTYHAEPGSPSAESLRLLASWSLDAAGRGAGEREAVRDQQ